MTCECVAADYEKHSSPPLWARDVSRTLKLTGDERVLDISCFTPTPPVGIRCGSLGKTIKKNYVMNATPYQGGAPG